MTIYMPPIGLPKSQRAIKVSIDGVPTTSEGDLPQVGDEEVLVRVVYVALNPVDSKSVEMSPTHGATMGCDFAGEVVQMGKAVSTVTLGARVCGCVFGNNPMRPDNGAFAEYVAVPARLVLVVPPTMPYQSAATLGVGLATVGLALLQEMRLKCTPSAPAKKGFPVLVSGAGTATGALATQILTLSGLQPIVTSSPSSFDRLRRLGAVATFDYQSPTCGSDIREYTANDLGYALDCHSDSGSMTICYNAIGSDGGRYAALNPFPLRVHRRRSVQPGFSCSPNSIKRSPGSDLTTAMKDHRTTGLPQAGTKKCKNYWRLAHSCPVPTSNRQGDLTPLSAGWKQWAGVKLGDESGFMPLGKNSIYIHTVQFRRNRGLRYHMCTQV